MEITLQPSSPLLEHWGIEHTYRCENKKCNGVLVWSVADNIFTCQVCGDTFEHVCITRGKNKVQ